MPRGKKFAIWTSLGVVALLGLSIKPLIDLYCADEFAENLRLSAQPSAGSIWNIESVGNGLHRLSVRDGRFRAWSLAQDKRIDFRDESQLQTAPFTRLRRATKVGAYTRNVLLRKKARDDCYWKIIPVSETDPNLIRLQATSGRYAGWYLDLLGNYTPDTGSSPPSAWNLCLNKTTAPGTTWARTKLPGGGWHIQSKVVPFANWYLGNLSEAKTVLENRCSKSSDKREFQSPPLAP